MSRTVVCCALVAACGLVWTPRSLCAQDVAPATLELGEIEARIDAALDESTSLQFLEQPLGDVAAFLEERYKIEVQLDRIALDSAGGSPDTTVTIDVAGVSLRSALRLALNSLQLDYCIRDGVLLITTPEQTESSLVNKVYDARHFLYVTDKYGERKRDSEPLFNLVMNHVEPSSWTVVGGVGSIELLDHAVVVSQPSDSQREVGQFMAALETARQRHQQGGFNAPIDVGVPTGGMTQSVRHALTQPASLQFLEQPLADVAAFLEEHYAIAVHLDTRALENAGVTSDTPVTIDVSGIPLANALKLTLDQLQLAYTIRDEVLLITTPEEVETKQTTRIYPVHDLLAAETKAAGNASPAAERATRAALLNTATPEDSTTTAAPVASEPALPPSDGHGSAGGGFYAEPLPVYGDPVDRLLGTITNAIDPVTWTDVGGMGVISYVPECDGIVITQTQDAHAQIERLLGDLRRMKEAQAATPLDPVSDGRQNLSLRTYRVTYDGKQVVQLDKLAGLIERTIEPAAWKETDRNNIEVIDQLLLIRTTNDNHRRIGEMLKELGYVK